MMSIHQNQEAALVHLRYERIRQRSIHKHGLSLEIMIMIEIHINIEQPFIYLVFVPFSLQKLCSLPSSILFLNFHSQTASQQPEKKRLRS